MKALKFVSELLAAVLVLAGCTLGAAVCRADYLAASAYAGHAAPEFIVYTGAVNNHDQWGAYGFGSFGWVNAAGEYHWADGYVINMPENVEVSVAGRVVVYYYALLDDGSWAAVELIVAGADVSRQLAPAVQEKLSLRVFDIHSGATVYRSQDADNEYGWIYAGK